MKKRYTKKQICEALAYWQKQLQAMNENIHDGRNIPVHQAKRVKSDLPTKYYIAVDMSDDLTNYGQYIRPDGTLTDDMSSNSFKECATTQVISNLKKMIDKAIAQYGDEYHIFVFHQPYSYGNWTHKNHARPAVLDVWYPHGKYWRYNLSKVNSLNEDASSNILTHDQLEDKSCDDIINHIIGYDIDELLSWPVTIWYDAKDADDFKEAEFEASEFLSKDDVDSICNDFCDLACDLEQISIDDFKKAFDGYFSSRAHDICVKRGNFKREYNSVSRASHLRTQSVMSPSKKVFSKCKSAKFLQKI